MGLINVLNHCWRETSLLSQAIVLKHMVSVQRCHSQEICAWDQFYILPKIKKSMALFCIRIFPRNFELCTVKKSKTSVCVWFTIGSYVGHTWIALWVNGSSGLTVVTHFQPCCMMHMVGKGLSKIVKVETALQVAS